MKSIPILAIKFLNGKKSIFSTYKKNYNSYIYSKKNVSTLK